MRDSAPSVGPVRMILLALVPALLAAPLGAARAAPSTRAPSTTARMDTVVVVVSARSSVTRMPRLHLVDLYLGRVTRFDDGGRAVPIDQAPGSPAREAFYEEYLGRTPAEIKAHWSKVIFTGRGRPPRDAAGSREVRELVAASPDAIGYIERSLVDESVRIVELY